MSKSKTTTAELRDGSILTDVMTAIVTLKDSAVEFGNCETLQSEALTAQLSSALSELDDAVERGMAEGRTMLANMSPGAIEAVKHDAGVLFVPEQVDKAIATGIKDTVLGLLEALLNAVPVPKVWKIVIQAIIGVVRAIQNAGGSSSNTSTIYV